MLLMWNDVGNPCSGRWFASCAYSMAHGVQHCSFHAQVVHRLARAYLNLTRSTDMDTYFTVLVPNHVDTPTRHSIHSCSTSIAARRDVLTRISASALHSAWLEFQSREGRRSL